MARGKPSEPKIRALSERGCLNSQPQRVNDPLFGQDPFFDARDLVQVKYEMLRRVRDDGLSVKAAAAAFGFSRPTYYQAQEAFEQEGLPGLVPRKRGPRGGHKLTDEVMAFLLEQTGQSGALPAMELARRVSERFGVAVHPRSVERALARHKKKLR
jgi:transposase